MPQIPADVLAAIGSPEHRPTPFTDAEIGWMMKVKARELIDSGEIKTDADIRERWEIRGKWITGMTEVAEETRQYWLKFEMAFVRSARKYLSELREIEGNFKK